MIRVIFRCSRRLYDVAFCARHSSLSTWEVRVEKALVLVWVPVFHFLLYYIPTEFPSPQSNIMLCFSVCIVPKVREGERPLLLILSKSVSSRSHIT